MVSSALPETPTSYPTSPPTKPVPVNDLVQQFVLIGVGLFTGITTFWMCCYADCFKFSRWACFKERNSVRSAEAVVVSDNGEYSSVSHDVVVVDSDNNADDVELGNIKVIRVEAVEETVVVRAVPLD